LEQDKRLSTVVEEDAFETNRKDTSLGAIEEEETSNQSFDEEDLQNKEGKFIIFNPAIEEESPLKSVDF